MERNPATVLIDRDGYVILLEDDEVFESVKRKEQTKINNKMRKEK